MNENLKALRAIAALPVATPEQAEQVSFVLCMRERMFVASGRELTEPGILPGLCSACNTPVVTSANSPRMPPRICMECALASGNLTAENAVRTHSPELDV